LRIDESVLLADKALGRDVVCAGEDGFMGRNKAAALFRTRFGHSIQTPLGTGGAGLARTGVTADGKKNQKNQKK